MELQEPPECPLCLQPYGSISTIPRVLACGHSLCEACIGRLPSAFPDTIRCPVCTQLVRLPNPLSSLPKNIDLLRYSSLLQNIDPMSQPKTLNSLQEPEKDSSMFLPALWSREFYLHWKPWILPENSVSTKPQNSGSKRSDDFCYLLYGCYTKCLSNRDVVSNGNLEEEVDVCLVKVGIFIHNAESFSKLFKYSYEVKVLRALYEMTDRERNELDVILNAISRHRRRCEVYGFWYCEGDNFVYLVCKSFGRSVSMLADVVSHNNGCMRSWAMVGLDICEAVHNLHLQGLSFGCLGASCFGMDEFGHACVDLCETLVAVRRVGKMIVHRDATCNQNLAVGMESEHLGECWFVSPEAMFGLLKIEGVQVGCVSSEYDVGFAADIWSLASLLLLVLIGKSFAQEMQVYLQYFIQNVENHSDLFGWYTGWMKRIICLFECKFKPNFISLKGILCKCLDFNPQNRPLVTELWTSLREVIVKPDIDVLTNLKQVTKQNIPLCFLFGELSLSTWKDKKQSMGGNQSIDVEEVEISKIGNDVIQGIPNGQIKCVNLIEHRDCITSFAIGGGFFFSSSFDKVVNVWSLQNLAHVHAFKGHEQRVTAVTFVDDEQPLCISGDNGGVICIWAVRAPLGQEPIKKICEQKDWRYSGIHALAVSGSKHLYTGSGDKSIKAWSLQDYTLSCTMTGHKSVVSSLVVCNEVLYSGSWDGTVRLWRISDHSLLGVLGENMPSNLTSVTSLAADEHSLVVSHQNGIVKIWYNDTVLKSTQAHNGAVFAACKKGRWIFTGGWDKSVNVQELCGEGTQTEATVFGSIPCDSVVTALLYWQGKLFIGQADSLIKVYSSREQ